MKNSVKTAIVGLAVSAAACANVHSITEADLKTATYIPMQAKSSEAALADFLAVGAKLVSDKEPNTKLWYALDGGNGQYGIFDVFPNEAARAEHFAGDVANALKENSASLVAGGWQQGVLNNVNNYQVLSSKVPGTDQYATEATYIEMEAKPGKAGELQSLLTQAAQIVAETEPKTVYWTGLQLNETTFAIFDTFTDESGRSEHFSNKVASILKGLADELVVGGWEKGVVARVQNFKIIAQAE